MNLTNLLGKAGVVKLNLNYPIRVKLNDFGREIYREHYAYVCGVAKIPNTDPKKDTDGFTEFQLWHFMSIFGGYCFNGCKPFMEDMNIYIDEESLKET